MKSRDLMAISMENYRKNGFISHVIFLLLSLFAAAFLLLCLFYVDLFLIIVPLIAIPIFFACQVIVILLRDESYLSLGGFFNCFKNYFTPKFASTFRVIRSALFSLAVYLVFAIVYGIIINLSFYNTNFLGYYDIANEMAQLLLSGSADVEYLISNYYSFFNSLLIYTNVPSLFVFAIVFSYHICSNSVGLFDRLNNPNDVGRLNKEVHLSLRKKYSREFNWMFIKLNWPLFLLFLLGFAGGVSIGYFWLETYNGVFTIGIVLAIVASFGLYGPFFLANNETIYKMFEDRYKEEKILLKGKISESLEDLIKKMEEENDDEKKDSNES